MQVGSASVGTTTVGADFSAPIPSKDWAEVMDCHLDTEIPDQVRNYPLFMVDSEGMDVRENDDYDFMITSPPAIIAKVKTHVFL